MESSYRIIAAHLLRRAEQASDVHREENVSMTHGTLGNAHDAVKELIDMIRRLPEDVDLEPWVVSKITIAEDYFDTVRDYLKQILEGGEPKTAGHEVLKPIDPEEFPDRSGEGLEGPFRLKSGLVVYYEPKVGEYYNSKTDLFLSHEDYEAHNR